jgi:hypothetical protein
MAGLLCVVPLGPEWDFAPRPEAPPRPCEPPLSLPVLNFSAVAAYALVLVDLTCTGFGQLGCYSRFR